MPKTTPLHERTLLERREALGLTVNAAAAQIGISAASLAKVEAGARGVTMGTIERVAEFYGMTLSSVVASCEAERLR